MTKTVVVAIDPQLSNFAVLGTGGLMLTHKDETYRVVVHNDPRVSIQGSESIFNFDIVINGDMKAKWVDMLPSHRIGELKRYSKLVQAVQLNQFAKYRIPPESFALVPTHRVGWGTKNYPAVEAAVVIKPEDGARGIGHFVVAADLVNVNYFLDRLDYYLSQDVNAPYWRSTDEFLAQFDGAAQYYSGGEKHDGEGLEALREQGLLVQSVMDVAVEYRLLTDLNGKIAYCQRRRFRDYRADYRQAIGSGGLDHRDLCTFEELPEAIDKDYLASIASALVGPMGSVDLFITKDNKWGIFEYCNQFGIDGVPMSTAHKLHTDYVAALVVEFIEREWMSQWANIDKVPRLFKPKLPQTSRFDLEIDESLPALGLKHPLAQMYAATFTIDSELSMKLDVMSGVDHELAYSTTNRIYEKLEEIWRLRPAFLETQPIDRVELYLLRVLAEFKDVAVMLRKVTVVKKEDEEVLFGSDHPLAGAINVEFLIDRHLNMRLNIEAAAKADASAELIEIDRELRSVWQRRPGGLEVKPSTEIEEHLMAEVQQHPTLAPMVRSLVVRKGRGEGE